MEKVMQPRKGLKLTDAEKKVLSVYSVYAGKPDLKVAASAADDKKILK